MNIKFPKSVTRNGSLYLSVFALPALGEVEEEQKSVIFQIHKIYLCYQVRMSGNGWWQNAISHPHASYSLTSLTQVTNRATESFELCIIASLVKGKTYLGLFQYAVPEAETFNLLGDQKEGDSSGGGKEKKKVDRSNPVTHLRSRILLSTMTEQVIAIFLLS